MSWTYTSDPANVPVDLVRFLCGDTNSEDPLLSDSEVTYLLMTKGSPQSAAIDACKRILAKLAREVDYTIGPESVSASKRFEQYQLLLVELQKSHSLETSFPLWRDTCTKKRKDIFDIGMHDAGGVDYGPPDQT